MGLHKVVALAAMLSLATVGFAQTEGYAENDGVKLHYVDWGGKGELMILLPDLNDTAWIFGDIAPALAKMHHVVSMTRRGCGISDKPFVPSDVRFDFVKSYTLQKLSDDIAAVMEEVGEDSAHLVGHGYAADELTLFARNNPDSVLSLTYIDGAVDRTSPFFQSAFRTPRIYPKSVRWQYKDMRGYLEIYELIVGKMTPGLKRNALDRVYLDREGHVYEQCDMRVQLSILNARKRFDPHYDELEHDALAFYTYPVVDDSMKAKTKRLIEESMAHYDREIANFGGGEMLNEVHVFKGGSHYMFADRGSEITEKILAFTKKVAAKAGK